MIDLNDPRWKGLRGGYRVPYDPRPALGRLQGAGSSREIWEELWNELHHQGDVGEASYAAIVALADIAGKRHDLGADLYALAAIIEVERHRKTNPDVPAWLDLDYLRAWEALAELALEDLRTSDDVETIRAALSVVALARRQTKLGAFLAYLDESELDELMNDRLAWSELYRERDGG